MSLGLGIFLSVLALILAWQIDKRDAWRKFGKISLWGVGVLRYLGWEEFEQTRRNRNEGKLVQTGKLDSYQGVKLGSSKDEVLYGRTAESTTRRQ